MEVMDDIIEANGHKIDAIPFRKALIAWGMEHFHPLSWRLTEIPYHILMAEIMLHRTQANQVVHIYKRFISNYSTLRLLAKGNRGEIKKFLYPLDYIGVSTYFIRWSSNSLELKP